MFGIDGWAQGTGSRAVCAIDSPAAQPSLRKYCSRGALAQASGDRRRRPLVTLRRKHKKRTYVSWTDTFFSQRRFRFLC